MVIIGLNYTKILVDKKANKKEGIRIKNNVVLKEVKKSSRTAPHGRTNLEFSFEFISDYEPEVARIQIEGDVLVSEDTDRAQNILDGWNKEQKTIPKDFATPLMSYALQKGSVFALFLSREVNLPPNIPLPKVKVESKK